MTRLVGSVMAWAAHRGFGPAYVLATTGRKSGEPRQVPVSPIEVDDTTYLVAPYGPVGWVKNLRADGRAHLRRGKDDAIVTLEEIGGEVAARVVAAYHGREGFSRKFMDVPETPTLEDFAARADQFPVFRVTRH